MCTLLNPKVWLNYLGFIFRRNRTVNVVLTGGLGNQLFQYATARAVSIRNGYNLSFEVSSFKKDLFYKRRFSLGSFYHPSTVSHYNTPIASKIFAKLRDFRQKKYLFSDRFLSLLGYIEKSLYYDFSPLTEHWRFSHTMIGYWQDERYFLAHRDTLLIDLCTIRELSPKNKAIADYIRRLDCPIAVHIRYNHEVKSGQGEPLETRSAIDLCSVWVGSKYYELATDYLFSIINSRDYIIFSDNPGWVRDNITIFREGLILEDFRGDDWEDIFLMKLCKHHIIANSSFSWWGAWLCEYDEKIVVAPKNFLYTPAIPASWIAIDPR